MGGLCPFIRGFLAVARVTPLFLCDVKASCSYTAVLILVFLYCCSYSSALILVSFLRHDSAMECLATLRRAYLLKSVRQRGTEPLVRV